MDLSGRQRGVGLEGLDQNQGRVGIEPRRCSISPLVPNYRIIVQSHGVAPPI